MCYMYVSFMKYPSASQASIFQVYFRFPKNGKYIVFFPVCKNM
jgi:hypothetical protein